MSDIDRIIENLVVERDTLRAALAQYADLDNWDFHFFVRVGSLGWLPCKLGPGPAQQALQCPHQEECNCHGAKK